MSDLFGKPMVLLPVEPPGCLARLRVFVEAWLVRGLLFGAGFLMGLGVGSCDG